MALLDNLFFKKNLSQRFFIKLNENVSQSSDCALPLENSYFRVVIEKIFIKNNQSFLNDYLPMIYSKIIFFEGGSKESELVKIFDPSGDQLLKNVGLLQFNQHISGPIPFLSPVVKVCIGLFRIKKSDHTAVAVKLLDSFSSFALGANNQYVKASKAILEGVDSLVFGDETFVLGIDETYDQENPLYSGYRLIVSDENVRAQDFYLKNNELYYGESEDLATPYRKQNFLIYRIDQMSSRSDFRTVEQIPDIFSKLMKSIKDEKDEELSASYKFLVNSIITSDKFTLSDKKRVIVKFQQEIQDALELRNLNQLSLKSFQNPNNILPNVNDEQYIASLNWDFTPKRS